MKRVVWAKAAVADLNDIKAYLAALDPLLADHNIAALVLAARSLSAHPGAGASLGYRRWRKWKPRGERHLLIYDPTADGINVVRVRHERNDWRPVPE